VRNLNYRTIRYPGHRERDETAAAGLRLAERPPCSPTCSKKRSRHTQDMVVIFVTATGLKNGRVWQESYAHSVYPQVHAGREWTAIPDDDRLVGVRGLDLLVAGRLPARGFVRQEDIRLDEFLANRFGRHTRPPVSAGSCGRTAGGIMSAVVQHPDARLQLAAIGFDRAHLTSGDLVSRSPIDGRILGRVATTSRGEYEATVTRSVAAFAAWRNVPAPRRGELVRLFGAAVRAHKPALAELNHARGRQDRQRGAARFRKSSTSAISRRPVAPVYGLTIASERARHHMLERWHPLGPVAVISAFQLSDGGVVLERGAFALVCAISVIWKPSEKTPLTALLPCSACSSRSCVNFRKRPRA